MDRRTAISPNHVQLLLLCDSYWLPTKVTISLAYFAYLRISNLVSRAIKAFDLSRHAVMADVQVREQGRLLTLRWSKTRQQSVQPQDIPISALDDPQLGPKVTWLTYVKQVGLGGTPDALPLLRTTSHPRGRTISAAMLTRDLRVLLREAGLQHQRCTPHSFRRGGRRVPTAPLEAIKWHGTAQMPCIDIYLHPLSSSLQ